MTKRLASMRLALTAIAAVVLLTAAAPAANAGGVRHGHPTPAGCGSGC